MEITHKKRIGWSVAILTIAASLVAVQWGTYLGGAGPHLALPWFAYALHVLVGYALFGLWYVAYTPDEKPLHVRMRPTERHRISDAEFNAIGSFVLMPVLWPIWVLVYSFAEGLPAIFGLMSLLLRKVSETLSRTDGERGKRQAPRAALTSVSESAMSVDELLRRATDVSKRYEAACKELEYRKAVLTAAAAGQAPSVQRTYHGSDDLWMIPLDQLRIEQERQRKLKRAIQAEIQARTIAVSVVDEMRLEAEEKEAPP